MGDLTPQAQQDLETLDRLFGECLQRLMEIAAARYLLTGEMPEMPEEVKAKLSGS